MLITQQEVRDYSIFQIVKDRLDPQLEFDIIQAEQDIFQYVGHKFTDDLYSALPKEVKLAFIKLSEYYALVNSDESFAKGIKTEKIGDYSYTLEDGNVQKFSLASLLADHVQSTGKKGSTFKVRSF